LDLLSKHQTKKNAAMITPIISKRIKMPNSFQPKLPAKSARTLN